MNHSPRLSLPRRRLAAALLLGLTAGAGTATALAQEAYPSKPLRIIVPFAAGTPPDVTARVVASRLPEFLKQPVVVENRPGASGTIGLTEVLRAPADGSTIGSLHHATATVASLYPQAKLDLVKDFVGVGQLEWGHNVLAVSPTLGVNTVGELGEHLKRNPQASYASSGLGTPAHLSGLSLLKATGTQAQHVPYNQFSMAITDVSSGRVSFMVLAAPGAVPQVQGGKLKALAVTGPTRNPNLKDVPTVAELGMPAMQSRTWSGLVVRAGTPQAIVDRLSSDIAKAMALPEVREALLKQQTEIPTESVAQFRELIRRDTEAGVAFIKANGIKVE